LLPVEVPDGFDIKEEEDGYTYGDERVDIEEVVVLLLAVVLVAVLEVVAVVGRDVEDDAEENVLLGKGKRDG
jgi:hypothetical protein